MLVCSVQGGHKGTEIELVLFILHQEPPPELPRAGCCVGLLSEAGSEFDQCHCRWLLESLWCPELCSASSAGGSEMDLPRLGGSGAVALGRVPLQPHLLFAVL